MPAREGSRVNLFGPLHDLWQRVVSYHVGAVAVEFIIIWAVVYAVVRFVQGTRAAGALKGLLLVMLAITIVSRLVGGGQTFPRLALLYDRFLALVAVGLIVIFQPELRRALVRLGETAFFRGTPTDIAFVVDEVAEACGYLSKAKFGAIIVIERTVGLAGLVEGGTVINADLSSRLLQSIFFPGAALHDLAVVIKGKKLYSAGVQLPLAEPAEMPNASFGSRHRAAVGLTHECDALVVVVSEETGKIRIAERGRLSDGLSKDELRDALRKRLSRSLKEKTVTPADEVPAEESLADAPLLHEAPPLNETDEPQPARAGEGGPDEGGSESSRDALRKSA